MLLSLLACTPKEAADTGPRTSDHLVDFVSVPVNECDGNELTLQAVFYEEVPSVVAEVRDGSEVSELHEVPFAGMDKETGELFIHESTLDMEADEAGDDQTTFSCDDVPYAGWRVYDEDGAIMACYFGDFVADQFDASGCPEE